VGAVDTTIRPLAALWGGSVVDINPYDALVSTQFFNNETDIEPRMPSQDTVTPEMMERVVVGSTAVVTTSLSVGYVIWILRGGSLLTAFVSALPAWQAFDPLPVLQSFEQCRDDEDDETLLSIATRRVVKGIRGTKS
jgi:hypothetical protein